MSDYVVMVKWAEFISQDRLVKMATNGDADDETLAARHA